MKNIFLITFLMLSTSCGTVQTTKAYDPYEGVLGKTVIVVGQDAKQVKVEEPIKEALVEVQTKIEDTKKEAKVEEQKSVTKETKEINDTRYSISGAVSFYGKEEHGGPTASGEKFNMWNMTCAHKSLPFGTKLKVTNVKTGKSVIVRVNDRGPFIKGRTVDLSYAAFVKIAPASQGVLKDSSVKIEVLR